MDEDDESGQSNIEIVCPRCKTPGVFPVHVWITFPDDPAAVLEAVSGRLNMRSCHVCGLNLVLQPAVFAIDSEGGRIAIYDPADEAAAVIGVSEGYRVQRCADYGELTAVLRGWLEAYLRDALNPVLAGSRAERNDEGVRPNEEPLVLLTLRAQLTGELESVLQTRPPLPKDRQLALVRALLSEFVSQLIDDLFTHAFHHDGIQTVLDAVERHVPPQCLDDDVLHELVARCIDFDPALLNDPMGLDKPFRFEYLCAVAHAAAGRENPRANAWAGLSLLLFLLRAGGAQVPSAVLLDTHVLHRTIDFPSAWNVALAVREKSPADDAEHIMEWLDHSGHGDRYRAEWAAGPFWIEPSAIEGRPDEEVVDELEAMFASLSNPLDPGPARVGQATVILTLLARAERIPAGVLAVERTLEVLADKSEWTWVARMLISAASVLNENLEHELARELLNRRASAALPNLDCADRYALVNEIGNSLRHVGDPAGALAEYDEVERLMDTCDRTSADDRATLVQNRAIVLRELGRFGEALAMFEEELAVTDDGGRRVKLLISLARTFIDANMPERALVPAEEACAVPLSGASAIRRIEALLTLAAARARVQPGVGLRELDEALRLAANLSKLRVVVSAATLEHARFGGVGEASIARAQAMLEEAWSERADTKPSSLLFSAGYSLARWDLDHGDGERAVEIANEIERLFVGRSLSWLFYHLRMRLPGITVAQRWSSARAALDRLEADMPDVAGLDFATTFLGDKSEIQAAVLACAREAIAEDVAPPGEYVDVFEFLNAREMGGRRPAGATYGQLVAQIEGRLVESPARLILMIEHADIVQCLVVAPCSPSPDYRLVELSIGTEALRECAEAFSQHAGAGCVTERQMRHAGKVVAPVLDAVGELLAAHTSPGEHVCLLPSPSMLGLPLHAASLPEGGSALERNCISVAPNLAVLERTLRDEAILDPHTASTAITVVCKRGDRERFVARAESAARAIEGLLGSSVRVASGAEVDKACVLELASEVEHLLFIGHGTNSTAANGRGLCVAANGLLPSAPLPIELAPQLARFVLDAGDLAQVSSGPRFVCSAACSSGRSWASSGGVRLGLERAFFTRGARTLLAPLWDVQASSALDFLQIFYERWTRGKRVGDAYKEACLVAMERYEHLFLWAPFALNGSWK
jgi:CHAT domain-containing protein/tetratricopeptide (TPR) repeat protein